MKQFVFPSSGVIRRNHLSFSAFNAIAGCMAINLFVAGCNEAAPLENQNQPIQAPSPTSGTLKSPSQPSEVKVWATVKVEDGGIIKKFRPEEGASVTLLLKNQSKKKLTVECKEHDDLLMPLYYVKTPASDDQIMEWKDGFDERKSDERWWGLLTPLGEEVWKEGHPKEKLLAPNETWEVKVELAKLIDMTQKGEYWVGFLFPMYDESGEYANEQLSGVVIQIVE